MILNESTQRRRLMKLDDKGFIVPDMDINDYHVPAGEEGQSEVDELKGLTENQAKWGLFYMICLVNGMPFSEIALHYVKNGSGNDDQLDFKQWEQARLLCGQL